VRAGKNGRERRGGRGCEGNGGVRRGRVNPPSANHVSANAEMPLLKNKHVTHSSRGCYRKLQMRKRRGILIDIRKLN